MSWRILHAKQETTRIINSNKCALYTVYASLHHHITPRRKNKTLDKKNSIFRGLEATSRCIRVKRHALCFLEYSRVHHLSTRRGILNLASSLIKQDVRVNKSRTLQSLQVDFNLFGELSALLAVTILFRKRQIAPIIRSNKCWNLLKLKTLLL